MVVRELKFSTEMKSLLYVDSAKLLEKRQNEHLGGGSSLLNRVKGIERTWLIEGIDFTTSL
jgi:hypothetical protein